MSLSVQIEIHRNDNMSLSVQIEIHSNDNMSGTVILCALYAW